MYTDTVTLFNRRTVPGQSWDDSAIVWYPTVLTGVNLNTDRATIASQYGAQSEERAVLNVPLPTSPGYLPPKAWRATEPGTALTFQTGEECDFFWAGEWTGTGAINDSTYGHGFYQFMMDNYDNVFAVSAVSVFSIIPHLEVTGK